MLINSYIFLFVFLPFSIFFLLLSSWIKNTSSIRVYLLTIISILFYGLFSFKFLILLSVAITANFFIAKFIDKYKQNSIYILSFGVLLNLCLLVYFKYANYFIDQLGFIANLSFNLQKIAIPIGLSFIVFHQISYLVDYYRGSIKKHTFIEYFLFISFFPKIIAGPIIRGNEFFYQLRRKRFLKFNSFNLLVGFSFLSIGLFKKIVLGDRFGFYADRVFNSDLSLLSQGDLWLGMFAYSMQIYFDFSGYSDMAIGVSRMFGIKVPFNFNSPYRAVSIVDFWRRWHITLSLFFRDYLYIPLGGNRSGVKRKFFGILVTLLLAGLWHGAGNTFLMWGLMHALMIITFNIWNSFSRPLPNFLAMSLTFVSVSISWVFFRADSIDRAFNYIHGMFDFTSNINMQVFHIDVLYHWGILFLVGFIIIFLIPNLQKIPLKAYRYWFPIAPVLAASLVIALLFMSEVKPFIYNAF